MKKWVIPFAVLMWCGFVGIAQAKEYAGFTACEIAHPTNCFEFVSPSLAGCRDLLGTFDCHHNGACLTGSPGCACNGPGIAEREGLFVPNDCEPEGFKNGWYYFDYGTLIRAKNLRDCRAHSSDGFIVGGPNYEQCFKNE